MAHGKIVDISKHANRSEQCPLKRCPLRQHCADQGAETRWQPSYTTLRRNETLLKQGDSNSDIFIVRSGSLKLVALDRDGSEQIVGFCFPGDIVNPSAIAGGASAISVVALESSSICDVTPSCLAAPASDGFYKALAGECARQLNQRDNHALVVGQRSARQRLAWFLVNISNQYAGRGFSAEEFNLSMSRHDIANFLALAIETVSRLLGDLARDEVIEVHGRMVTILDAARLRTIACMETEGLTRLENAS